MLFDICKMWMKKFRKKFLIGFGNTKVRLKNRTTFMGPIEKTGVLTYQLDDHYNGKDIELKINDRYKERILSGQEPVKIHTSCHEQCDDHTISDQTEYIIIKTWFAGAIAENTKGEPHVEILPLRKRDAVFKDPKYGSATITFTGSDLWESVDLYYFIQNPLDENFVMGTTFSYLNLKNSAKVELADDMFEITLMVCTGGGNGSGKKITLAQAEETIDKINHT